MNDSHEDHAEEGIFTMDLDDTDDTYWIPPSEACRGWLRMA